MTNSTIWVLVANEKQAFISASSEGSSVPLYVLENDPPPGEQPVHSRCGFACAVMLELCRGALNRPYGGLIIFADPVMAREMQAVMPDCVTELLIAEPATLANDEDDICWETPTAATAGA